MQWMRTVAATAAVLAAVTACGGGSAPTADEALRADLEAAQRAATRPAERTQFVSAVELGRTEEPRRAVPRATAPRRPAPQARPTRAVAAAPVARPAPVAPAPARAREVAEVPAEATDAPEAAAVPSPAPDGPVVAAPSRRTQDAQEGPRRRGRVWGMGDVIRNAPFPINP